MLCVKEECSMKGLKKIRNSRGAKERFLFSLISKGNSGAQNTTENLSSGREYTGQFGNCQAHEPLLTESAASTALKTEAPVGLLRIVWAPFYHLSGTPQKHPHRALSHWKVCGLDGPWRLNELIFPPSKLLHSHTSKCTFIILSKLCSGTIFKIMVQCTVALIASRPLCICFLSKCTDEVRSSSICSQLAQLRRLTRKKQYSSPGPQRFRRKLVITSPNTNQMELEF